MYAKENYDDLFKRVSNVTGDEFEDYRSANIDQWKGVDDRIFELGCEWIKSKEKHSLYIFGPPGSGKTHFAHCLIRGSFDIYNCVPKSVSSICLDSWFLSLATNQESPHKSQIEKIEEADLLCVDDYGTQKFSPRSNRQMFGLIDKRINNDKITLFTSNFSVDQIHKMIKLSDKSVSMNEDEEAIFRMQNGMMADRICQRLSIMLPIEFENFNMRKKSSINKLMNSESAKSIMKKSKPY